MITPFSLSASLTYPPDDGLPAIPRVASGSGTYESKAEFDYKLTGSGTQAVNLGTIPGVKGLQVEVDPDATNPTVVVNIRLNASSDNIQLTPGGSFTYFNPTPQSGGITGLNIVYTVPCVVRVRALG